MEFSRIGLGCMGMSEFYGEIDEKESAATLEKAVHLGVTHFDTADMYGTGSNEELVGKALKPYRDQVFIATKFGIVRDPNNPAARGLNGTPAYVKNSCENSLKRLGIDTIDLYYLHRLDPNTPIEETVEAMAGLVKEGKVKYIGLSEANANIIRRAQTIHPIAAVQTEYSLWSRGPEKEIIPLCKELNICFVAYSPLGRGFLSGKIKSSGDFDSIDWRPQFPRFHQENITHNLKVIDVLESFAKKYNATPSQIALAWLFAKGDHITAIPGTKRRKYLEENVKACDISLSKEDLNAINEAVPVGFSKGERYPSEFMKAFQYEE